MLLNNWKKMCKCYYDRTKENECEDCPLQDPKYNCSDVLVNSNEILTEIEKIVNEWIEQFPNPTWAEWLEKQGVVRQLTGGVNGTVKFYEPYLNPYTIHEPIPDWLMEATPHD